MNDNEDADLVVEVFDLPADVAGLTFSLSVVMAEGFEAAAPSGLRRFTSDTAAAEPARADWLHRPAPWRLGDCRGHRSRRRAPCWY